MKAEELKLFLELAEKAGSDTSEACKYMSKRRFSPRTLKNIASITVKVMADTIPIFQTKPVLKAENRLPKRRVKSWKMQSSLFT